MYNIHKKTVKGQNKIWKFRLGLLFSVGTEFKRKSYLFGDTPETDTKKRIHGQWFAWKVTLENTSKGVRDQKKQVHLSWWVTCVSSISFEWKPMENTSQIYPSEGA